MVDERLLKRIISKSKPKDSAIFLAADPTILRRVRRANAGRVDKQFPIIIRKHLGPRCTVVSADVFKLHGASNIRSVEGEPKVKAKSISVNPFSKLET